LKRPIWARRSREKRPAGDPAPAILARVAATIATNAPKALRGRGALVADTPCLHSWSPQELASAQVWHSDDGDAIDLWCVLGANDARLLLNIVLKGPAGDEPTPLERNIVRDTIERLLAATGRVWEERASAQLPPSTGWCCRLTLTDALGAAAAFTLHCPPRRCEATPTERVDLRAIPVAVDALLPAMDMQVDAIARWSSGEFVALACAADAAVRLRVGAVSVASGSLGTSRGRRAILVSGQR
jgi:hypothetical protein